MSEAPKALSEDARRLLGEFEAEFLDCGYMYSGCLSPTYICRKFFAGDDEASEAALAELREAGIIQIRACEAFKYELSVERRAALIELHDLAHVWSTTMPARVFYPTEPHGEIGAVRRAMRERACPVCNGKMDAHNEGCTDPNAPNFCKGCKQVAEHCESGHCLNCQTDAEGLPFNSDCDACNFACGVTIFQKVA